jgi:hypothetical protein
MSVTFTDGRVKVSVSPGLIVPVNMYPYNKDPNIQYSYQNAITGETFGITGPVKPPPATRFLRYTTVAPPPPPQPATVSPSGTNPGFAPPTLSTGNYYQTPNGLITYLASGVAVPDGWVITVNQETPIIIQTPSVPIPQTDPNTPGVGGSGYIDPNAQLNLVGSVWITPGGGIVYANAGSTIPADWKKSPLPFDPSKGWDVGAYLPTTTGGWYEDPTTGTKYLLASGQAIPPTYITTSSPNGPNDPTGNQVDPNGQNRETPYDIATKMSNSTSSTVIPTIAKILGLLGVAGVSYVGYLYLFKPQEIRTFIMKFDELKTLIVDSAQMAIAVATIIGISFVSYEFWISYEKTGTFGGAIGDLTAKTIETLVEAGIDAIETLFLDAWEAFKTFWSNWHPLNPLA